MDKQQILNGLVILVLFWLLTPYLRKLRRALPRLWRAMDPWLGGKATRYQRFIDSLVNDKEAQVKLSIEILRNQVKLVGLGITFVLGIVLWEIGRFPEAPGYLATEGFYLSLVAFAFLAGPLVFYIGKSLALDLARRQEQALKAQESGDKTAENATDSKRRAGG